MWLFWLTLAFSIVAVVASLVFTTRRALQFFRDAKSMTAATSTALDAVTRSTEQIERHLELATESGTRLEASLARLRASRARLDVQRAAIDDVRASLDRLTALAPRK
jgi:hypothetical protein